MGTWRIAKKQHTYYPLITNILCVTDLRDDRNITLHKVHITCGGDFWHRLVSTSLMPALYMALSASVTFILGNIQRSSGIMKGKWAGRGNICFP